MSAACRRDCRLSARGAWLLATPAASSRTNLSAHVGGPPARGIGHDGALGVEATMHIDPVPIARTALPDATAGGGSAPDRATGVTAVILAAGPRPRAAAGPGSRRGLGCKPLAIVGGVTLLERAVATARGAGIARVMVIVASPDGSVASFCRANLPAVEVALASDSARGNGASAAAGLGHAGGRCLVMMVDHLHETATLERLMRADGDFVLAIDSRPAYVEVEEATLVRQVGGAVVAIAKQLSRPDAVEAGLAVCRAEPLVALAATLDGELEFSRLKRAWLDAGRRIDALDIDGAFWADVDTPQDRRRAVRHLR